MEGFIHYAGTGLPAQYYWKMHQVLLPKGPTAQRRIHFLANMDHHRQYEDYKECLTQLSLLQSILKQDDKMCLLHCESTGTKVHTNILLSILGFSFLPWIDQGRHTATTTKDDRFNCHTPHSLESSMRLNWDRNWFPQPRKDCDFGATQLANLFANSTAATRF